MHLPLGFSAVRWIGISRLGRRTEMDLAEADDIRALMPETLGNRRPRSRTALKDARLQEVAKFYSHSGLPGAVNQVKLIGGSRCAA